VNIFAVPHRPSFGILVEFRAVVPNSSCAGQEQIYCHHLFMNHNKQGIIGMRASYFEKVPLSFSLIPCIYLGYINVIKEIQQMMKFTM
jgi:hypothetical protein